jgi:SAM-dependent methyltransferase
MAALVIPERDIRGRGPGFVLAVCWRQWRTERRLARRGLHFRSTRLPDIVSAYGAMNQGEFDAVNGRQDWANWRTIPRALNGHVPDRPLAVLDLGCGTGSSTQVLAWYCPAGSRIIGYEVAAPLLDFARRRVYRHHAGGVTSVAFVCQGIGESFRSASGAHLPERSVDLINSSGVVGFHLDAQTVQPLIAELRRVLAPEGCLLRRLMTAHGFSYLGRYRSWLADPTGEMAFRMQNSTHRLVDDVNRRRPARP